MRSDSLLTLPPDLPAPVDDGAADHLKGMLVPSVPLQSTSDRLVDPGEPVGNPRLFYCYPRTGTPDQEPTGGVRGWNQIPGARGCTPQTIAFRDHFLEFQQLGIDIFGLSTQSTSYQREVASRLELPFELLSEESLALANALRLPTFQFASAILLRRLTMVVESRIIIQVFYPVFPPSKNAEEVLAWFKARGR